MKIKNGFILRKLGNESMVVAVGEAGRHFNGMIRLNATGAWLWEQLKEDITRETLLDKMCAAFDGLDRATAENDLDAYLTTIKAAIDE